MGSRLTKEEIQAALNERHSPEVQDMLDVYKRQLHNMPFEVTPETVAAALNAADAYGRYFLGE